MMVKLKRVSEQTIGPSPAISRGRRAPMWTQRILVFTGLVALAACRGNLAAEQPGSLDRERGVRA